MYRYQLKIFLTAIIIVFLSNTTSGDTPALGDEWMGEFFSTETGGDEIDEDLVRKTLRNAVFFELGCAVFAFWGSVELWRKQNYNLVLIGCTAAIIGLGSFLLSTLFGAIALYLTFQCKPEFGIDVEDESW